MVGNIPLEIMDEGKWRRGLTRIRKRDELRIKKKVFFYHLQTYLGAICKRSGDFLMCLLEINKHVEY